MSKMSDLDVSRQEAEAKGLTFMGVCQLCLKAGPDPTDKLIHVKDAGYVKLHCLPDREALECNCEWCTRRPPNASDYARCGAHVDRPEKEDEYWRQA